jgi:hypothetical protein
MPTFEKALDQVERRPRVGRYPHTPAVIELLADGGSDLAHARIRAKGTAGSQADDGVAVFRLLACQR